MKKIFPPILSRVCEHLKTDKNQYIAEKLLVEPQTVSTWKSRNDVPFAQAISFAKREKLNLEWLLTGEGPMRRNVEDPPPSLTPDESTLLDAYRSTDEPGRAALLATAKAVMRKA
ncbi:MAG: helix-turn-helix domain-containing protein [Magnetococcales bacterium]|nr:helix-turn-helix domain-containing protein [Magnetococcales bacterium]